MGVLRQLILATESVRRRGVLALIDRSGHSQKRAYALNPPRFPSGSVLRLKPECDDGHNKLEDPSRPPPLVDVFLAAITAPVFGGLSPTLAESAIIMPATDDLFVVRAEGSLRATCTQWEDEASPISLSGQVGEVPPVSSREEASWVVVCKSDSATPGFPRSPAL
jgi:hypothetical protein